MWFGLGYLAALTGLYCFYLFTDVAFILPGAFVLFIAAGCGAEAANRYMREVLRNRNRKIVPARVRGQRDRARPAAGRVAGVGNRRAIERAAGVLRDGGEPREQDSTLPRDATVVSNISLQFLDLYLERIGALSD